MIGQIFIISLLKKPSKTPKCLSVKIALFCSHLFSSILSFPWPRLCIMADPFPAEQGPVVLANSRE